MSDPDRLSSHDDKTFGRDARGLILRILWLRAQARQTAEGMQHDLFDINAFGAGGDTHNIARLQEILGGFQQDRVDVGQGREELR